MSAWKDLERRVAKTLGGVRSGAWASGSDVQGVPFSVEVKRCTRYSLRRVWVEQARRQARSDGKPWILVVGEHGDRRPIVVMEFATFVGIAQGAGLVPSGAEETMSA
jgi:hypothetical protein